MWLKAYSDCHQCLVNRVAQLLPLLVSPHLAAGHLHGMCFSVISKHVEHHTLRNRHSCARAPCPVAAGSPAIIVLCQAYVVMRCYVVHVDRLDSSLRHWKSLICHLCFLCFPLATHLGKLDLYRARITCCRIDGRPADLEVGG